VNMKEGRLLETPQKGCNTRNGAGSPHSGSAGRIVSNT
jgi:hypothetical protein